MKINTLNYIAEEHRLAEFALFLERSGIFDNGTDLEEIEDNGAHDGIRALEQIAAGNGDDLSQDEVALAAKSWKYIRRLATISASGLKEQLKINQMVAAGTKKADDTELEIN